MDESDLADKTEHKKAADAAAEKAGGFESTRIKHPETPNQPKSTAAKPSTRIPKFIVYTDDCIVVATARRVPFTYVPFIPMVHMAAGPNGQTISEPINKDEKVNTKPPAYGQTLRYTLELLSLKYQFISAFELDENELVCDMKFLFGCYIIVCTSFCEGEDKLAKGRVLVLLLSDIIPDPARPYANKTLRLVSGEPMKSPCLACEELRGCLAVCVGTRLMVYEVNVNTGLMAVGRCEIAMLSTSLFAIKNYIFISDIFRGARFYFLRPKDPLKLHLLGQTNAIANARHVQGLVFSERRRPGDRRRPAPCSLGLIVYDKYGTIHVYSYSPAYIQSGNGLRLIKRAEINTKISSQMTSTGSRSAQLDMHTPVFVSGNVVAMVHAVPESRMMLLAGCIAYYVENTCGINVRNYLEPSGYCNVECKGVLSERLLLEFFYFSTERQQRVLRMAGCSYEDMVDAFNEVFY